MANKSNIFSVLPQDHSEDEDNHAGQQARNPKKQTNKKDTGKVEEKTAQGAKTQDKAGKDDHKKNKKVPEPGSHPLDRHSGTGNAAFDKKAQKKGGHGKGNVGVATKEEEETKAEEGAEGEDKPQEPEKPEGITLEEYYANTQAGSQSQVDQAKLKAVQDELTKDLLAKKGTLYVKKTPEEEKPVVKKTTKANVDHHAAFNSEHADLLNFRTGFVEREFKERKEGEKPAPRPAPKKEEKTEEAPAEGEKAEGDAPAEGEKADGENKRGKGGNYRGNNRGDNRGGNRGGKPKGGNYHGGNKGGNQPKINVEDDSAFPKLG